MVRPYDILTVGLLTWSLFFIFLLFLFPIILCAANLFYFLIKR